MEPLSIRYVTTQDGLSIAYSVCGEGRALVHIPGVFSHIQLYWTEPSYRLPWLHGLGSRFRLIQYDGRGQGLSTRGLDPETSMGDLVSDLREVVRQLNLNGLILMAQGGTCHIAIRYATQNPDVVAALILLSPAASNLAWPSALFETLPSQNWDAFLQALVGLNVTEETRKHRVERLKQTITQADWGIRVGLVENSDVSAILPFLKVPTLVLHPHGRLGISEEEPAKVAARIPHSLLTLINGETDYGDSDEGIQAIESFLKDILQRPAEAASSPSAMPYSAGLSRREIDVLKLIAAGKTNAQIAEDLVISLNTVQHHVSNILDKTGVGNRREAAAFAHRNHLA